jgi:hypothetical protein
MSSPFQQTGRNAAIVVLAAIGLAGHAVIADRPQDDDRSTAVSISNVADHAGDRSHTLGPNCADCPPGAILENEPDCGLIDKDGDGFPDDTVNGGCFGISTPPTFTDIACGDTICGTAVTDGQFTDADYYRVTITQPGAFTWTVTSEFTAVIGMLEYINGTEGSGDCADLTLSIVPFTETVPCETASVTTVDLPAGTYFFSVDARLAAPLPCGDPGSAYTATLIRARPEDLNNDGSVDTVDLFQLLAAWGVCGGREAPGCPADFNGDGEIGSDDLFQLLSAWGAC